MGMEDFKIDGGLAAIITIILGAVWGGIMKIFSVGATLERHDSKLDHHEKRMEELEAHMDDARVDLKAAVSRTEQKIDRLIERFIPDKF